jgi:hypothetical protein
MGMPTNELTEEEHNQEFTGFLKERVFGLVANIDRPSADEHFPMASGVVVKAGGQWVLLTVAHYLEDLIRWKNENRLASLFLHVFNKSGDISAISLSLDENLAVYLDIIDIGIVVLNESVSE